MRMACATLALLGVLLPAASLASGAEVARLNTEGNRLYSRGEYEKALARYAEALQEATGAGPERLSTLHYNMGNALYRLGRIKEAAQEYAAAGPDSNPLESVRDSAQFNEGNTKLAAKDYKGAADLYRRLLTRDPSQEDVRHNLELALARQKLKKQQESQKKSSDDHQKKKAGSQKEKGPSGKSPGEDGSGEQHQDGPGAGKQEGQEKKDAASPSPGKPDRSTQAAGGAGGREAGDRSPDQEGSALRQAEIGREEAERLLKALDQDERADLKEALKRPRKKKNRLGGHDW